MAPQAPSRKDNDRIGGSGSGSGGMGWIREAIERAIPGLTEAIMASINSTFGRRIERLENSVQPVQDLEVQVHALRDEIAQLRRRLDRRTDPRAGAVPPPPPRVNRNVAGVGVPEEVPRRLRGLARAEDLETGTVRYQCPRCGQLYASSYVLIHVRSRCPMRGA